MNLRSLSCHQSGDRVCAKLESQNGFGCNGTEPCEDIKCCFAELFMTGWLFIQHLITMRAPHEVIDLAAVPPSERFMMVICPENEIRERRASEAENFLDSPMIRKAGRITRRIFLGPIFSAPAERAIDTLAARFAVPQILYGTPFEVERANFALPGYLQLRTLYVMHPKDSSRYFPAAIYHHMVFEDKFAEVLRLLSALGATNVVVEHEHGWSSRIDGKMHVPMSEVDATVDLTTMKKAGATSKVMFEASFDGSETPCVPENLIWFSQEPMWQRVADGRINGRMKSFSVLLQQSDDFGVSADLVAKVEGVKVGIGGKFASHVNTVWKISGDFC